MFENIFLPIFFAGNIWIYNSELHYDGLQLLLFSIFMSVIVSEWKSHIQGGGVVRPTTNYIVIFKPGSGQLLITLWFFNQGLANY